MECGWGLCRESRGKYLRLSDICCLLEVRWKGQGAKMIGNCFKFFWSGGCKAENGVGVVASWLIGKALEVGGFIIE